MTRIREASGSDAAMIASLVVAAFEEYRGRLEPPSAALLETSETIESQLVGAYGATLAEVDGVPAGCVLFTPRGRDLYFGRLSVLPAFRRTGLAEALVASVESEAARRGCDGVLLSVRLALPANQRLFTRLGYSEVARHAHPGFDHPTYMDMRKAL